jgi:hypothetical protein
LSFCIFGLSPRGRQAPRPTGFVGLFRAPAMAHIAMHHISRQSLYNTLM